jgi:hypothetical protein
VPITQCITREFKKKKKNSLENAAQYRKTSMLKTSGSRKEKWNLDLTAKITDS